MQAGAKKVIGIELCQQAIDDAKENAKLNGILVLFFNFIKMEYMCDCCRRTCS